MLDSKVRYLQIAFNYDLEAVNRILPQIPRSNRILIEAGTPFIKKEGFTVIRRIRQLWGGGIVADLKTADGAVDEVRLAYEAGANAATVLGNASTETLNLFIDVCEKVKMDSMIDMIHVEEPHKVLLKLAHQPDVVILHKGRDEESTRGKVIQYKNVKKIKSKYAVLISAAGGVDLREARSAIFNGASIVVVNLVRAQDGWAGIRVDENVAEMAAKFLKTIE
jgi:bifunctional enzyme Fae/Hps